MNKWPENIRLFVNGGPDDGCQLWDIWHDGGPGGHCFDAYSEQMANNIVSAIDELQSLREENAELRSALRDYLDNDDTNEGGKWEELNAPWLAIKRRAEALLCEENQ